MSSFDTCKLGIYGANALLKMNAVFRYINNIQFMSVSIRNSFYLQQIVPQEWHKDIKTGLLYAYPANDGEIYVNISSFYAHRTSDIFEHNKLLENIDEIIKDIEQKPQLRSELYRLFKGDAYIRNLNVKLLEEVKEILTSKQGHPLDPFTQEMFVEKSMTFNSSLLSYKQARVQSYIQTRGHYHERVKELKKQAANVNGAWDSMLKYLKTCEE